MIAGYQHGTEFDAVIMMDVICNIHLNIFENG